MSYTPKAGDEVYSSAGELGLYVSCANGGGHIVQPMIENGRRPTPKQIEALDRAWERATARG